MSLAKPLFLTVGWLAFLLGLVGIFLPLLPTTPFMIIAAACFARSSERCHHWLTSQPSIGPTIQDWERHGAISRRVKYTACGLILASLILSALLTRLDPWAWIAILVVIACVLSYIWTRPEGPSTD